MGAFLITTTMSDVNWLLLGNSIMNDGSGAFISDGSL